VTTFALIEIRSAVQCCNYGDNFMSKTITDLQQLWLDINN